MDRQRRLVFRPAGRGPGWILAVALAVIALPGCGNGGATAGSTIPAATSAIVGGFVEQIDGQWGYATFRPASWSPAPGPNQGRAYLSPQPTNEGRLILLVHNLGVEDHQASASVQWQLFLTNPTLAGWTRGLERSMASDDVEYELLEQTPDAKVYATVTSGRLALNAFIVDDGQPLSMALLADAQTGALEPLDRLRATGVLADFGVMVRSMRAIPHDPAEVSPPLD